MLRNEHVRLFVGTAIPSRIGSGLHERVSMVLAPTSNCRVAPIEQLHVTAIFIGNRSASLLPSIQERIARVASITDPFTLTHGRFAYMPKADPYMLWVRFRPHKELTALHYALANALGADPSIYKPYWPHITLARCKGPLSDTLPTEVVLDRFHLDHLTLFRSHRGPEGSQHTVVDQWPLTAP